VRKYIYFVKLNSYIYTFKKAIQNQNENNQNNDLVFPKLEQFQNLNKQGSLTDE
jgi:hypothetical protein